MRSRLARLAVTALLLLGSCELMTPSQRVARRYGVSEVEVARVAAALGVPLDEVESLGGVGDGYFPSNYYALRYTAIAGTRIRRSELIRDLKGYKALCRSVDSYQHNVLAFYYSTNVKGGRHFEVPMVIEFTFRQPIGGMDLDPPFGGLGLINMREPEVNPPLGTYYEDCLRLRRINGVDPK